MTIISITKKLLTFQKKALAYFQQIAFYEDIATFILIQIKS